LYFICQTCDNFAACLICIKNPKHQLLSHSIDHLFYADKPFSNTHWTNRNLSITCNLCNQKNFPGKHYRCRQCSDYNVCSNCLNQAKIIHYSSEKHIFDFIPNPSKIRSNQHLLAERTIQFLRYRNANFFEQDQITGWTMNQAKIISQQALNLYFISWKEASELFKDEDINSPPDIIEYDKLVKILVSITNN